jgi:hypothetical protein
MAKIIQFDPSRKVCPMYYTPEALRGRLLQFKVSDAARSGALANHNPPSTKIS